MSIIIYPCTIYMLYQLITYGQFIPKFSNQKVEYNHRIHKYTPEVSKEVRRWKGYYTLAAVQFPTAIHALQVYHHSQNVLVGLSNHIDNFSYQSKKVVSTYNTTSDITALSLRNDGLHLIRSIICCRKHQWRNYRLPSIY
jgi:hypothetical protein